MKMLLSVAALLLVLSQSALCDEHIQNSDRFGQVRISSSSTDPENTVLWFTEDGSFGNLAKEKDFDSLLAASVKVQSYVDAVRSDNDDCSYIAGEIVRFGQSIQSDAEISSPAPIWLGGEGKGASLAYAIYAQRPQDFLGVLGLNFCPDLSFLPKLCQEGKLTVDEKIHKVTKPVPSLDHAFLTPAKECNDQTGFASPLPSPKLTEIFATHTEEGSPDDGLHLGSLSLIPVETDENLKGRVLFFSGDGGWAALDTKVSELLSKAGYDVYGVDCLRYYWKSKQPSEAAADLATLLKQLHDDDPHIPIYLMGYSFGADILPHVSAALDSQSQALVKGVLLINPEQSALFEVHISEWLGVDEHDGEVPTAAVAVGLTKLKPYCLCSAETEDPLCAIPNACKLTKILPGDHHFDGDFESVEKVMLEWLKLK